MSCEDIPSLLDLQRVKEHADDFGRLMGTGTGTSTNGVTGQVRPIYNAVMANLGYTRVGTFASGGTLLNGRQTLLWDIADGGDGQEYGWSGVFPLAGKVVPPGSTPLTTGGIAVGAWMSRFDPELRTQVIEALRRNYAEAGYNLVAGSFESGGTLVNANDVLLQERTGKGFTGPAGTVAAGTNPASGGFVDVSNSIIVEFASVFAMKGSAVFSESELTGKPVFVKTFSYYRPTLTSLAAGGATYMLTTLANAKTLNNDSAWVPDGWADHYLDMADGASYVALLIPVDGYILVEQCGAKGDYFLDHKQQTVNPSPTDDTRAFQAASRVSFHIVMRDRGYYAEDTYGAVDLTAIDNGTPRSQYRVTGASRMRTGIYYSGAGIFWKCQARGGSNTYFEYFRMKNVFNSTDTVASITFNETTSVGVKLESATHVTFHDVYIQGFGNGVLPENVAGTWCEFITFDNCELFRNLNNLPLRVNGGTNSFHGFNSKNLIIHTVPNGYGMDVGEGVYLYNSHLELGFYGTGAPSEVSFIARAGAGGNANVEQCEFAIWSEKGGKVVIQNGAKVDAQGFWHEHLNELVIEDGNTTATKGFLVFDHGKRTWSSKQPTNKTWGGDTITALTPGVAPGSSPLAGLHAADGVGRSTVLGATDSPQSGHHFAFGITFENIESRSYVDVFGGYHPDSKNAARYSYSLNPPTQGSTGHARGSVVGVQTTSRQADCRPLYSYTSDGGSTPFALAAQMIYSSGARPSAPITGQAMWYTTTSSPSWYNGSGWVEATVSASDASLKTAPEEITDNECRAAIEMKLVKFKMLDAVEEKGFAVARYHYGVIAQQCVEVLEKYGVDIDTFAPLLRAPVFDDDGNAIKEIWKVRYEELLVLQNEAIRRKIAGLI